MVAIWEREASRRGGRPDNESVACVFGEIDRSLIAPAARDETALRAFESSTDTCRSVAKVVEASVSRVPGS